MLTNICLCVCVCNPWIGSDGLFVVILCRRDLVIYLNAFSGEATIEFPSTLQMARGGVCFLTS